MSNSATPAAESTTPPPDEHIDTAAPLNAQPGDVAPEAVARTNHWWKLPAFLLLAAATVVLIRVAPPSIEGDVTPSWYYFCVGAAVILVGIAKAGFGGGIGVLAVPLMAIVMLPTAMLGLLLPVLIAADILSNAHYLKAYDWKRLSWLVYGAVGGVIVASIIIYFMKQSPPDEFNSTLKLIIGIVCLLVVAMQGFRLFGKEIPTLPTHPASGIGVGFVAGGVSTLCHAAGPIVAIYLLQEKLPKRIFMGTILLYFLLINTAKLPTFIYLGYINKQTLWDSIWFIPLLPMGTIAGAWMNKHIPEKPFAAIMYVAAGFTAVYMIYGAMA